MTYPVLPLRWVLAAFAVAGIVGAVTRIAFEGVGGEPGDAAAALSHGLFVWLLFGVLSPIALAAARRFPLRRERLLQHLPVHGLALVAMSVTHTVVYGAVMQMMARSDPSMLAYLRANAVRNVRSDVIVYALIVGAYYLYAYALRDREREHALTAARLDALTLQLQPHFLFNTLNSISTMVLKGDRDGALRMVSRLADLLRATLASPARQTAPLADELELVRRYLDIEAVRFSDRLRPIIDVQPDTMTALVPVLMMQTLVENAIRHGVAADPGAGALAIRASRMNGALCIEVTDDGPGPPQQLTEHVGLSNVRSRLHELYGDRARLTIGTGPAGGGLARLELPL